LFNELFTWTAYFLTMRLYIAVAVGLGIATSASAAQLQLDLKSPDGRPVADAVVTFMPASGVSGPVKLDTPREMAQQHIAFVPHVLLVPAGAVVSFPNRDTVRHHVYSFSAAKRFELKLYSQEQSRTVEFDKAGVVALGCNIHDKMSGYIVVVDTPYAAQSDAGGRVTLTNVPDGPGVLTIWSERLKAPDNHLVQRITLQGQRAMTQILDVRPAPAPAAAMSMPMGGT
jgi:plastocyanin